MLSDSFRKPGRKHGRNNCNSSVNILFSVQSVFIRTCMPYLWSYNDLVIKRKTSYSSFSYINSTSSSIIQHALMFQQKGSRVAWYGLTQWYLGQGWVQIRKYLYLNTEYFCIWIENHKREFIWYLVCIWKVVASTIKYCIIHIKITNKRESISWHKLAQESRQNVFHTCGMVNSGQTALRKLVYTEAPVKLVKH